MTPPVSDGEMGVAKQGNACIPILYRESDLTLNAASSSLIPCMVVASSFNRQFCDTSAWNNNISALWEYCEHTKYIHPLAYTML
jgi:hypothetical protein